MQSHPFPAVITPGSPIEFPPDDTALSEPNGLIAIGGDLEPERLIAAYRRGIFPWYEDGQPVMWWTPQPRCVLFPDKIHISRSLRKVLRNSDVTVSLNRAFDQVIRACAEPREPGGGTWITEDMIQAYEHLHRLGHAHSVEVWHGGLLTGGLYGVIMGACFFGESMFSRESNASKIALVALCQRLMPIDSALIDCQMVTSHLLGLGAQIVPRAEFRDYLDKAITAPSPSEFKSFDTD